MFRNTWLAATKILIWILFISWSSLLLHLVLKGFSPWIFFSIDFFTLSVLFILSLLLCFKPSKLLFSFTLGFILADLFLHFISFTQGYIFLSQKGAPLYPLMLPLFFLIYKLALLYVAYKAYKTCPPA